MELRRAKKQYEPDSFDANIDNPFGFDDTITDFHADYTDNTDLEFQPEIDLHVPVESKSISEIARDVEDSLLDLLAEGKGDDILFLLGGSPDSQTSGFLTEWKNKFNSMFSQAIQHNPALRWYGRLLTAFNGRDAFGMREGALFVKAPRKKLLELIREHLHEVRPGLASESPIVDLLTRVLEGSRDSEMQQLYSRLVQLQDGVDNREDTDLDIASVDMKDRQMADVKSSEVRLDDSPALQSPPVVTKPNRLVDFVSFKDLSNKGIAEYLVAQGVKESREVESALADQGFKKARINEIAGIVGYLNTDRVLSHRSTSKLGRGDVDFDFEF